VALLAKSIGGMEKSFPSFLLLFIIRNEKREIISLQYALLNMLATAGTTAAFNFICLSPLVLNFG
jgi:hypothetical protein